MAGSNLTFLPHSGSVVIRNAHYIHGGILTFQNSVEMLSELGLSNCTIFFLANARWEISSSLIVSDTVSMLGSPSFAINTLIIRDGGMLHFPDHNSIAYLHFLNATSSSFLVACILEGRIMNEEEKDLMITSDRNLVAFSGAGVVENSGCVTFSCQDCQFDLLVPIEGDGDIVIGERTNCRFESLQNNNLHVFGKLQVDKWRAKSEWVILDGGLLQTVNASIANLEWIRGNIIFCSYNLDLTLSGDIRVEQDHKMVVEELFISREGSIPWPSGEIGIKRLHWNSSELSIQSEEQISHESSRSRWHVHTFDVTPSKINLEGFFSLEFDIKEEIKSMEVSGTGELNLNVTAPINHLNVHSRASLILHCFSIPIHSLCLNSTGGYQFDGNSEIEELWWYSGTLLFKEESQIRIKTLFIMKNDIEGREVITYFFNKNSRLFVKWGGKAIVENVKFVNINDSFEISGAESAEIVLQGNISMVPELMLSNIKLTNEGLFEFSPTSILDLGSGSLQNTETGRILFSSGSRIIADTFNNRGEIEIAPPQEFDAVVQIDAQYVQEENARLLIYTMDNTLTGKLQVQKMANISGTLYSVREGVTLDARIPVIISRIGM